MQAKYESTPKSRFCFSQRRKEHKERKVFLIFFFAPFAPFAALRETFKIVAVAAVVTVVGTVSSCKYDDGPKISLATKKSRVANVWKIEKSFTNDTENPCDQACKNERDKFTIILTKDGNVMVKGLLFDQSYESFGEWQFNSDKTKIGIKMKCRAEFVYYKILRLKSGELWTEYIDPVTKEKYETHRIPA